MFKGMKALPKALIIGAIVAAPIAAYVKFMPQKPAAPVVEAVAPVAVPAESALPTTPPPNVAVPSVPAPAPVAPAPAPALRPANDAGLNNLLK